MLIPYKGIDVWVPFDRNSCQGTVSTGVEPRKEDGEMRFLAGHFLTSTQSTLVWAVSQPAPDAPMRRCSGPGPVLSPGNPSLFLKYVRAARKGVLPITLIKADSEIDPVILVLF